MRQLAPLVLCSLQLALAPSVVQAATDTANFDVKLVITESCDIHTIAPTDVNFGTQARTDSTTYIGTTAGSVTVNCSPGTVYSVGLNGGDNAGATPAPGERRMQSTAGVQVPYDLYQDAAASTFWGNSAGTLLTGIGTGTPQTHHVFGQIRNLNFPAGTYVDTITATVTY